MLEGIPTFQADHRIYRYANPVAFESMLAEMGLDAADVEEILGFLGEIRGGADGQRLLDAPFAPKPQLEARKIAATRFSDGSLRVLYSSLEPETAELEVMHWYADAAIGGSRRVAYYNRFRCRFRGSAADLRPRAGDWPFLIDDGDEAYARCQALAREAIELRVAGLLTPSARRADGTNLPVFRRQALAEPEIIGVVAFSRHASTGEVMVRHG
ncbi:MAG: RES family NAD+ phosphorylase [Geminicoccaceae bacterium]